jgi:hypothetical protein
MIRTSLVALLVLLPTAALADIYTVNFEADIGLLRQYGMLESNGWQDRFEIKIWAANHPEAGPVAYGFYIQGNKPQLTASISLGESNPTFFVQINYYQVPSTWQWQDHNDGVQYSKDKGELSLNFIRSHSPVSLYLAPDRNEVTRVLAYSGVQKYLVEHTITKGTSDTQYQATPQGSTQTTTTKVTTTKQYEQIVNSWNHQLWSLKVQRN